MLRQMSGDVMWSHASSQIFLKGEQIAIGLVSSGLTDSSPVFDRRMSLDEFSDLDSLALWFSQLLSLASTPFG